MAFSHIQTCIPQFWIFPQSGFYLKMGSIGINIGLIMILKKEIGHYFRFFFSQNLVFFYILIKMQLSIVNKTHRWSETAQSHKTNKTTKLFGTSRLEKNIMPHQNKMCNMVTTTNQPKRMKKKKKLGHTLSHSYQKSLFTESLISYATTKIVLMIEVSHNATVRVES